MALASAVSGQHWRVSARPMRTVDGTRSVLLSLAPDQELTLETVTHDPGLTACNDTPESSAFTDAAIEYIR